MFRRELARLIAKNGDRILCASMPPDRGLAKDQRIDPRAGSSSAATVRLGASAFEQVLPWNGLPTMINQSSGSMDNAALVPPVRI
jgi:hypothetical protein